MCDVHLKAVTPQPGSLHGVRQVHAGSLAGEGKHEDVCRGGGVHEVAQARRDLLRICEGAVRIVQIKHRICPVRPQRGGAAPPRGLPSRTWWLRRARVSAFTSIFCKESNLR